MDTRNGEGKQNLVRERRLSVLEPRLYSLSG
jgi:hypothetical protein